MTGLRPIRFFGMLLECPNPFIPYIRQSADSFNELPVAGHLNFNLAKIVFRISFNAWLSIFAFYQICN